MRNIHKNIKELFRPEEWTVTEFSYDKETNKNNETIFCIGNGYLGMRGFFEEGFYDDPSYTDPTVMINGVYEYFDYHYIWCRPGFPKRFHAVTKQINPAEFVIFADGERVDLTKKITEYRRVLHMDHAFVTREFCFETTTGKKLKLCFSRFASKYNKHLIGIRVEIQALDDVNLELVSSIQGQISEGNNTKEEIGSYQGIVYNSEYVKEEDGLLLSCIKTKRSDWAILCAVKDNLADFGAISVKKEGLSVSRQISLEMKAGNKICYERLACYYTDRDCDCFEEECKKAVLSDKASYSKQFEEHCRLWRQIWENSDVTIENKTIQQGVRFAILMLNSSAGDDGKTNISANGLTGVGYSGHTFWDTEIFMLPLFLYTNPELAKQLLMYRYHILPNARIRAKEMEDQGALFAWNSINGEECGHVFEAATGQYHINNDIFFAIYNYMNVTDDQDFLRNYGAEILFEISKCMAHRGAFVEGKGFCINVICGPDEYNPNVDNNMYTNLLTQMQLNYTYDLAMRLKKEDNALFVKLCKICEVDEEEINLWRKAACEMYIPYNKERELYMQDDQILYRDPIDIEKIPVSRLPLLNYLHPLNLWRFRVIKQADIVLLTVLCKDYFTPEMRKKIFDFYEPLTIHDSSLSAGVHAIAAVDIGYMDEAIGYYRQSSRMDLDNVNRNTYFGVHAACMGAAWLTISIGYGGMSVKQGKLHFSPKYDQKLGEFSFRIVWRSSRIEIAVKKTKVVYKLLSGNPVELYHQNISFLLKDSVEMSIGDKRQA